MTLVDSHCHLNYEGLVEDQVGVLDRARSAGIGGFLNISTKKAEWRHIVAVAEREPDVWASIGVHPHAADQHLDVTSDTLVDAADHPKVIGLGETGLDYFYDHSDRMAQQTLFRRHIAAARKLGLPVIIHTRDAEEDSLAILQDELRLGHFPALIHCFTGTEAFAEAVLELGLFISISGIVTFKNARGVQAVAAKVPNYRLLVETDSPFLAPVPHRGRLCEPAYLTDTLSFLADLRGTSPECLAEQTTANFRRLFSKAAP